MPGFDQTTPINAGRTLGGRYKLVAPIARGGMAEVWEGHDEILSRPVAVKVLQAHLATDDVFLERFRREAITAARLAHPGVVSTFDTGVDAGTAYIVMELVRGRTLRQLLSSQGPLEPWEAVGVTRQIAEALGSAHAAGLVHRDVKPANVLLVEDDTGATRVKVTDFGIAKAGAGLGHDLTRTGMVLGTPKYLSPEQIRGEDPDARADLYSLGVMLYEMLAGRAPFVGENDMGTAMAHLNEKVPKVSATVADIPKDLDRLVADLLAKEPDRRIQSALELRDRLDGLGPLAPPGRASARSLPNPSALARTPGGPDPARPYSARPYSARPDARPDPGRPPATWIPGTAPPPAPPASPSSLVPPPSTGSPPLPGERSPRPDRRSAPAYDGDGDGTLAMQAGSTDRTRYEPAGPSTDEFERPPVLAGVVRNGRTAGIVVAALVAIGAIVAIVVLATEPGRARRVVGGTAPTAPVSASARISSVSVFMVNGGTPDDVAQVGNTFDGNPATSWHTDTYTSPAFGNLYPGIGLSITLNGATAVHTLKVTSPTDGWSAQAYVSPTSVAAGQPLSAWGQPVDGHTGINGSTSFNLGGHRAQYVLLWITYLGPADSAAVSELSVN